MRDVAARADLQKPSETKLDRSGAAGSDAVFHRVQEDDVMPKKIDDELRGRLVRAVREQRQDFPVCDGHSADNRSPAGSGERNKSPGAFSGGTSR